MNCLIYYLIFLCRLLSSKLKNNNRRPTYFFLFSNFRKSSLVVVFNLSLFFCFVFFLLVFVCFSRGWGGVGLGWIEMDGSRMHLCLSKIMHQIVGMLVMPLGFFINFIQATFSDETIFVFMIYPRIDNTSYFSFYYFVR